MMGGGIISLGCIFIIITLLCAEPIPSFLPRLYIECMSMHCLDPRIIQKDSMCNILNFLNMHII